MVKSKWPHDKYKDTVNIYDYDEWIQYSGTHKMLYEGLDFESVGFDGEIWRVHPEPGVTVSLPSSRVVIVRKTNKES